MEMIFAALAAVLSAVCVLLVFRLKKQQSSSTPTDMTAFQNELREFRSALDRAERQSSDVSRTTAELSGKIQTMADMASKSESATMEFTKMAREDLERIRETVAKQLDSVRSENTKQLDAMRQTVDEKLQTTLNKRLNESFAQVSTRLEQVYKGLGEMQTLAEGVGDLKKVLSNVKTRGIVGEYQLGSILEDILSPNQYECNVATVPKSTNRVEFAIKIYDAINICRLKNFIKHHIEPPIIKILRKIVETAGMLCLII